MYLSIKDLPRDVLGGLYILNTFLDKKLCVKIGKTERSFYERLKEYKNATNIKFIECYCDRKESVMLHFLKNRTSLKPIHGREYFDIEHRDYLEKVLWYFGYLNDKDLMHGFEEDYLNKFYTDINVDKEVTLPVEREERIESDKYVKVLEDYKLMSEEYISLLKFNLNKKIENDEKEVN